MARLSRSMCRMHFMRITDTRTSRSARCWLAAVLVAAMLVVAPTTAIGAKSKADTLQDQLTAVQAEFKKAGAAYDKAYWKLDETESRIDKIDARIADAEDELGVARVQLAARVNGMYRSDDVDYLTVILGAESFQDMVTRFEFISRINRADADAIQVVEDLETRLSTERASLEKERADRESKLGSLKKQRDKLQKNMKAKKAEYDKVKAKLDATRRTSSGSSSKYAPAGPNGMVFPVQGVNYYSDTWGASRSGGRRRHQGTDIMSPSGTPCVAVLSGTVTSKNSGLGGKTIWLTADNGWKFYYAHLSGWKVKSGRVSAGQVIGYVGSTGNASASSPHLHFEIHPGGGSAVNPYPYLRKM